MNASATLIVVASFAACAVEAVEALTIVLAVGVTRGWRATLIGAGLAAAALAALVALLGPALSRMPIDTLRLLIGTLLLVFGLQWLRKAILRASGFKVLRDEQALYRAEVEAARVAAAGTRLGLDWYAFTLSFKGVFLEGLEVAFIVLTFGTARGSIGLAALGAGIALLVVVLAGLVLHQPLSRVPENAMKFAVGLMLATFGIFWSGEGSGIDWPGGELALLWILAFLAVVSYALVFALRRTRRRNLAQPSGLAAQKLANE
ncbi:MAG: hypothetical protein ABR570_14530 [Burkholderiales bacterium]